MPRYTVVICPVVSIRVENVEAPDPEAAVQRVASAGIGEQLFDRKLDELRFDLGGDGLPAASTAVLRCTECADDYTQAFVDDPEGKPVASYNWDPGASKWEPSPATKSVARR